MIGPIVGPFRANLSGGFATMMPNDHITIQAMIGRIRADGQFDNVQRSSGAIIGDG